MTSTIDEGRSTFAEANLPFPPIPEALEGRVKKTSKFTYSTREDDAFPFIIDVVETYEAGKLEDYVSVGYVEHGVNSYTLQYQLVYRQMMLFMEVLVGGGYSDREGNLALAVARFRQVEQLLDTLEQAHDRGQIGEGVCLLIRDDLSISAWLHYDATSDGGDLLQAEWHDSIAPVEDAIAWLKR